MQESLRYFIVYRIIIIPIAEHERPPVALDGILKVRARHDACQNFWRSLLKERKKNCTGKSIIINTTIMMTSIGKEIEKKAVEIMLALNLTNKN